MFEFDGVLICVHPKEGDCLAQKTRMSGGFLLVHLGDGEKPAFEGFLVP